MSLDEDLEESVLYSYFEESNQCVLTITIPRFSSFSKHGESSFTGYETSDDDFKKYFTPKFYANGDCKENEGYVSILFDEHCLKWLAYVLHMEFNCMVSVIDTAGFKRFKQTFIYIFDRKSHRGFESDSPKLGLDRYLKRETLCNEPSELLPGDCLNVHVEVNYLMRFMQEPLSAFAETVGRDGAKYFIRLDSSFGRKLCEVCEYFQRASDTPMIENKTRRVYFPHEEFDAFHRIFLILMGGKGIKIGSMADIYQLYAVADKYDFQIVIETCRQLLKSFLCRINDSKICKHAVESIPMISELAERYNDESLKEMIVVYLDNKKKFETDKFAFEEHVKYKLATNWTCESIKEPHASGFYIWVSKKKGNGKEPELDLYK